MIPVGKILGRIRRSKDYQQNGLHAALYDVCSLGQIRDIEAGRTKYIKPVVLFRWMEWLELNPMECEFLVQENVRCLCRDELGQCKALAVRPQLLAVMADLAALLTRGKQIGVQEVTAQITKHILPHLMQRPPYIDSIMTTISKEQNE